MKRLAILLALAGFGLGAADAAPAAGARAPRDARAVTAERLDRIAAQVREFRVSTGELPASREGVEGVVADPADLVDGWGNPVLYLRVAGGFWVVSWGADGAPGGTGDAADVVDISR